MAVLGLMFEVASDGEQIRLAPRAASLGVLDKAVDALDALGLSAADAVAIGQYLSAVGTLELHHSNTPDTVKLVPLISRFMTAHAENVYYAARPDLVAPPAEEKN